MPSADPRAIAFRILRDVDERGARVRAETGRAADAAGLSAADRGLLREITAGVTRRRLSLDTVIDAFSKIPPDKIDGAVRRALRIGLYQILFLDRIPARAAVDTTVDLVKRARAHATGFANALLRAASRAVVAREEDPGREPRRALPIDRNRWAIFDRDVLPDPEQDEVGYLARAHSHPDWLVERWLAAVGPEATLDRVRAGNRRPQTFLRIRAGHGDALRAALREAPEPFAEVDGRPDAIRLERDVAVSSLPGYGEGWFVVQDITAQAVVDFTGTTAGESVLDVGSAPGGKTAALADAAGVEGWVAALDLSEARQRTLAANVRRLRLERVYVLAGDVLHAPLRPGAAFDRVLVDAPCSNTGVLRRRVEARWRLALDDVVALATLQTAMLVAAADLVRPGGTLVYSTCTLEPEENGGVVEAALRARADLTLDDTALREPGAGDGGYLARLVRRR